jgi:hypothetical protein
VARVLAVLTLCLLAAPGAAVAAPGPLPRVVLALYDSRYEKELRFLPIHQIAEMPLNHLGLVVRYHDVNTPLPPIAAMTDVRGVITWFRSDSMADPLHFLEWADAAIDAGKRFVVVGDIAAAYDLKRRPTPRDALQAFWARLGLRAGDRWTAITYDWAISQSDPRMFGFERKLEGALPAFGEMRKLDPQVRAYLVIRRGGDAATDTPLVAVGPHGGYVAAGYVHYSTTEDAGRRQWYLNPFEFFREALNTDELPKPDTTTLSGRRLFYSHIDGDGWRNLTELQKYRGRRTSSAEVILEEVLRKFPDLPVTVAPIAADLDPEWHGSAEHMAVARRIFALPHVEAGSHTYSHPLEWQAFATDEAQPALESSTLRRLSDWIFGSAPLAARSSRGATEHGVDSSRRGSPLPRPRSYEDQPFTLDREIGGAIAFLSRLLPPGKRVEILQWSGNTTPAEGAIAATRAAGVRNLNGGDTRFDPEFPSYGWVAPLARQVANQRQVYASNSNENTYTHLWTERFFGFRYLTETLENTASPRRVKPHNIYFHVYSGEKIPSLSAVLDNYRYAQKQELAPTTASHFAAIVDGFFTARLTELGPRSWRVAQRDGLQTIRVDGASASLGVDYARSNGIIGHRLHQGSLYVALDPAVAAPVITLDEKPATSPYLVHSRWLLSYMSREGNGFAFRAHGFGPGQSVWKVKPGTKYVAEITPPSGATIRRQAVANTEGLLTLDLGPATTAPVQVTVRTD